MTKRWDTMTGEQRRRLSDSLAKMAGRRMDQPWKWRRAERVARHFFHDEVAPLYAEMARNVLKTK